MAAELVGGALLSGSIDFLLNKIASSDVASYLLGKKDSGFDVLLRRLRTTFRCLSAVLMDAEQKQIRNQAVEEWLDELQDAVEDAENLFDEIEYDALELKVEAESKTGKSKVRNFFSTIFNSTDRERKIKMGEILARLEDFEKRRYMLDLKEDVRKIPSQRLPSTSLIDDTEVYGRDDEKHVLKKTLLSDEVGRENISVIPIVGMGGIGKTTLAQAVFNDNDVEKHFKLRVWVCVSEEFDVIKLTKIVFTAVTEKACDVDDLNVMQVRIQKELKGKKFLIVLDDVWKEDDDFWNLMMIPFKEGAQGSKIIVTTRSTTIASIMGATQSLDLEELKEEACLKLLTKCVSGNEDSAVLEKIEKEIVKKCKGLPLAVKALGSLLRNTDVKEWGKIVESDILDLPDQEGKIIPALRLSYHYLPSHLKRCFAYCSLFPKDYNFEKEKLVFLWMAGNILKHPKGNERLEEVGDKCFDDLLSRSFFQRSSTSSIIFVMHDLMVDLARFVFGKKYVLIEEPKLDENVQRSQVRHIAYYKRDSDIGYKIDKSIFESTYLRTFLPVTLCHLRVWTSVGLHDLLRLKCLRYLSLKEFTLVEKLPKSIGELRHLRYLDLSGTAIKKLPKSLCRLYNLQALKLSRCIYLAKLPRDLYHLINLRYLDIKGSPIVEMPTQISKLKNLQELTYFVVEKNNGTKIKELGELSYLRGRLSIDNINNVVKADNARAIKLREKHIEELELNWGQKASYSENASNLLDTLFPNTTLKTLRIRNYEGMTFPKWVGDQSYDNLVTLSLYQCKFCKTLPPLGQLSSLKSLQIVSFDATETVGVDFYGTSSSMVKPFASLEELRISYMPNWKQWSMPIENVEAFLQLRTLYIYKCQRLTGDLPCLLPSLIQLSISDCPELASSLPMMPTVTSVELSDCQRLAGFQVAESFNFPQNMEISDSSDPTTFLCFNASLRSLRISDCNNFEFPPNQTYESLEHLSISYSCDTTTSFRLDSFPNIRNLFLNGCGKLESVTFSPDSHLRYPALTQLDLLCCPELESFPRSGLPSSLRSLSIDYCDKLTASRKNWNLQALPNLKRFKISGYKGEDMESFPEPDLLPATITFIGIYRIDCIISLDEKGFQQLTSLKRLEIISCPKLQTLPREGLPTSLQFLTIHKCPFLEEKCEREKGEYWSKIAHIPRHYIWS